jgi:hypothetical protein
MKKAASVLVRLDAHVPREGRVEAGIVAVGFRRLFVLELRLQPDIGPQEEFVLVVIGLRVFRVLRLLPACRHARRLR